MSYYLGKEVGYDGCGALTDEYVVYMMEHNPHQHTYSLVFLAGFVDIDTAVRFLKDCYEEKVPAERIQKARLAHRKRHGLVSISNT